MSKQVSASIPAAVALGSNLPSEFGGIQQNLWEAITRVRELGAVSAVSTFRVTDPVGFAEQPQFLNGALLVETRLGPLQLMQALLDIELRMGRRRLGVPDKGPRIIDLDLIWMGNFVLQTDKLTLPHPAMSERAFVLEPLCEIAPEWVHPTLGLTVVEMLGRLQV